MSQTQLPTQEMQEQELTQLHGQLMQQAQQIQMLTQQQPQQDPNAPQGGETDPQQQLVTQAHGQLQQLALEYQKASEAPTTDQVLHFLKDNKAKSFVLDIETDSTILQDENAEKQRRTEFVQVLGTLLPQIAQMIQAEPKTAGFCGELLKFSTAPFRAGRSLDGAIDELIEQMKAKGDQPKGDDPQTAQGKIALQIEQMKQQTAKEKNQADAQIKAAEMQQKDKHKQWELQNERALKQAELQAKAQDAQGKVQIQNQKAATDREAHQMHVLEKQQDMDLNQQKAEMAMQAHANKQGDMANRANERQMMTQAKLQQRPQGPV